MAITPINPNKPDTIGGNTNTHDPKWIDWGPDQPNPTFNIDDPQMWLPMTAISGLASGYCERAAVISGGKLATGVTWPDISVTGATATRANIVSKLANNIALGIMPAAGDPANMYVTADAKYTYPKSNTTSTYMYAMDAMISTLIGVGGFVQNRVGDKYNGAFTTLAQNASARSVDCGSNINRTITKNATVYQLQMGISYPAKWAEERKWLLDELRWVGNAKGNIMPAITPIDLPDTSIDYYKLTRVSADLINQTTIRNVTTEADTETGIIGQPAIVSEFQLPSNEVSISGVYTLEAAIPDALKTNDTVCMLIDGPFETYDPGVMDYNSYRTAGDALCYVSTAMTFDANQTNYVILNGGTLSVPANTELNFVEVDSGGTLTFIENTRHGVAAILLLEDGCTLIPTTANGGDPTEITSMCGKIFQDNRALINDFRERDDCHLTYIKGGTHTQTDATYDKGRYITGGATVTVETNSPNDWPGIVSMYVSNATVDFKPRTKIGWSIIDSGGIVRVSGARMVNANDDIYVLSGGTLTIEGDIGDTEENSAEMPTINVFSGGSCIVTGAANAKTLIYRFILNDGAYFEGHYDTIASLESCFTFNWHAEIRHLCTLGLTGGTATVPTAELQPGWNLFTINNIDPATTASNTIFSVANPTYAMNTYLNDANNGGLDKLATRIHGYIQIGNGGQLGVENTLVTRTGAYKKYGACIRAINKQAGPTAATNAYPSFRCRQLYTDLPAT